MSTTAMMLDNEMEKAQPVRLLDAISALPPRRGTPPMERAPESIFTALNDEPELSDEDRDWLDSMTAKGEQALEGAVWTCLNDYRAGGGNAALQRAVAVIRHVMTS